MSRCAEFFTKFGGHKMAAGLSMNEKDIEGFREKINEYCTLTDDEMTEKMLIDIPLPVEYATMDLAKELSKLEPYGNGNRRPLFARKDLIPYDIKVLGKNRNTVKLKLRSGDHATGSAEAISSLPAFRLGGRLVRLCASLPRMSRGCSSRKCRQNLRLWSRRNSPPPPTTRSSRCSTVH